MSAPLTVLCVTGWCRNGSTIIGNVLNEVPGFFHVGELHFLWKNATGRGVNDRCGCGEPLTGCPIWSSVLPIGRPEGTSPDAHAETVIGRQWSRVRTRHTWRVLRRGLYDDEIRAHADLMGRVYRGIAERTGARVIVDTTKIPGEAALLSHLPGIRPYYVHLVRDPRAVAHSWREPKQYVYAMSAARSTAYWHGFNLASAAITRRHPDRSVFLRYEEFAADPTGTVDALLRLCGADPAGNPVHGRTVQLHPNHTVTGNPDRFRTGSTVIRDSDDGWRHTLSSRRRLAATALAWPLFGRYGYRFTTGPAAARVGTEPDNGR
ncbi:sulfotransferase [Micromonospora rifamycinica]|uniref:sulfotransferase n=1 Tax=Micromonospora rifamycinica TaxID=291594 RepID=UPI002E2C3047|nr:sulfotransferase [Micromonospora rifamycinica]